MSSGICKNEEEEKKNTSTKSTIFNFWIYFGIIILGLLFIILIVLIIYSFFSNKEVNNYKPITTSTIPTPTFQSNNLTSFQNIPIMTTPSMPPPLPQITTETISTNKKPFLTSLMSNTTENTDKAIKSFVSPLYNRTIPIKTTGGFRCINRNRF